ncbi:ParA family protein [Ligilactobacillus ruminis]|uniref:ParA family protein n=1 Tax=Ligilactobacillus ruminis TaxID=1623 RepID=A0AAQ2XJE4_9LACO|nr:ParA family protein [Ligilactobacillus ruminis]WDC81727.1 ParA family protein [Ligilactobacillus ruminis]
MASDGKVISFINMKGGVGKTTLCREIGYTLNKKFKKSILFIDIDPQANLTQSLFEKYNLLPSDLYNDLSEEEKEKINVCNVSIGKLFDDSKNFPEIHDIIVDLDTTDNKLSLIPGDLETVFLERSNSGTKAESSLDKFIVRKEICKKYDFILIDCPPTYSFYTTTAFNASDYYLVPVGIDPYSVLGIDLLEQVVEQIKENDFRRFDYKTLQNMGIIFNPNGYTSNPTGKKLFDNQRKAIKNSKKLKRYDFYYFEHYFEFVSTYKEKLDFFSIDKNNKKSNTNIINITQEFIDRIEFLNSIKKMAGGKDE